MRDVVEELVELVAEEERQASVASASPPVVQAPKSFLGAQWILMESCLLEMQEIKKQFVAEKARAHALQQDLAVQKDKVASLEQEREEEDLSAVPINFLVCDVDKRCNFPWFLSPSYSG